MQALVEAILYDLSYFMVFAIVVGYFIVLYAGIGVLFKWCCALLEKRGMVHKISEEKKWKGQLEFEIRHSFLSILIFGLSAIPLIYAIRNGYFVTAENRPFTIIFGLIILTIWNEVHFFVVHRLMHLPYFFKKVHKVHHASKVPTVFSVFSFHPLEAFLLSTVPLTILPFISISSVSIFLFPLVSILLNFAGHCNYRFGNGKGASWKLFGTRHHSHHYKKEKRYGFASGLLDRINQAIMRHYKH